MNPDPDRPRVYRPTHKCVLYELSRTEVDTQNLCLKSPTGCTWWVISLFSIRKLGMHLLVQIAHIFFLNLHREVWIWVGNLYKEVRVGNLYREVILWRYCCDNKSNFKSEILGWEQGLELALTSHSSTLCPHSTTLDLAFDLRANPFILCHWLSYIKQSPPLPHTHTHTPATPFTYTGSAKVY